MDRQQTKFQLLEGEHLRRVIAVIALAVTVYYLYWRITETFNQNALFFSWVLWLAELFGFFTTILFYFTTWKPITREAPPPLEGKMIDVFVPTKSEPVSVLRKTLLACRDLDYPHRTVVLDDGNRSEVRELCEELSVTYLARDKHEGAKAGNINFGLDHSDAEFIAIFDADHAPLPHFIDRLIGYFKDDEVGFVQTPQEFYNIDSFQHRVDERKRYIWAEQYLFHSLIQPGRDYWNAAYFVGSCAILRRKALDDIDGFATASITEDLLTSIRLHSKGWKSVYHNEHLAYGIAAETIQPFHIQRHRWGIGGWQVFFKENPLFKAGLSFRQRLCYLASLIYPIEGFQKLIFYVTPPIVLFTGILPMRALDIQYLLHFIPYYTISLYAYNEMSRGFGGTLMLEQFSMGKFFTYLATLFAFLLPKRKREFKVTPKADRSAAPGRLLIPQYIVAIVSIAAVVFALVQIALRLRHDEFIVAVNSLWAFFNCGLAVAIILYARKKFWQRRETFRIVDPVPVFFSANGSEREGRRMAVAYDLTKKGMSLLTVGTVPEVQHLQLEILLPKQTITLSGAFRYEKTATANGHRIARGGLRFNGAPTEYQDTLSRYLSESAVSKFLREYATRYRTYLERWFERRKKLKKREKRVRSHLPVTVLNGDGGPSYGVIKNASTTGLYIATRNRFSTGNRINIVALIERDLIDLEGTVVRDSRYESTDFPEYSIGVALTQPRSFKASYVKWLSEQMERLVQK